MRSKMAASLFRRIFVVSSHFKPNIRYFHTSKRKNLGLNASIFLGVPCVCAVAWRTWRKYKENGEIIPVVQAAQTEVVPDRVATYREIKFQQFASVQYDGIIYMTPQDFLESVTEETPRPRIGRTTLTEHEVESMLKNTPPRKKGSRQLFRSMHNKACASSLLCSWLQCLGLENDLGIISYTEYLFLLCVLTKPQSGFRIAFNMFDTDGNQIVDKKEFLVLEGVFSKQRGVKGHMSEKEAEQSVDPIQDTTLLIHFFGKRGNDVLKYDDFHRFMANLQSEVIELEFLEFSKGMQTISEEDFARILLRYTNLDKMEIGECLARVRDRMPEEKGISFEEFKQFCQFMNSIDDFTIAMNMYTYAQQPVSRDVHGSMPTMDGHHVNFAQNPLPSYFHEEEFQRAVKVSTGTTLGSHIVDTVFNIFDVDGDGHLSYKEFISIMKDRMHRGSRSRVLHNQGHWDSFKSCVKNEMRSY